MKQSQYDKTSVKAGNLDVKFLPTGPNGVISSDGFPELNKPCMAFVFPTLIIALLIASCGEAWF